jgi:hypothetical protein
MRLAERPELVTDGVKRLDKVAATRRADMDLGELDHRCVEWCRVTRQPEEIGTWLQQQGIRQANTSPDLLWRLPVSYEIPAIDVARLTHLAPPDR